MKRMLIGALVALLCGLSVPAFADQLMMVRSTQTFPEAMLRLQEEIKARGYSLSRVQRVDVGLTGMGYQTDLYRVVFFGKPEEIRRLSREYPQMIPYLPLKIAVFAEDGDTLLVATRPSEFARLFDDPELSGIFARWEADMDALFDAMRVAE
ncbi:MAG: DUF302 domain-containing protein [Chromatiales bacterium]|jgi:uncharacterized protein (DUF302 family)|nr:DUF302 domain-containing protein [Chromatiales bacterium]MDX9768020.1 DUF302 domain-containing protein [Ectothiorhodospiraceae bacterium]